MVGLLLVRELAGTYWPLDAGVSMAKMGSKSEIRSTKSETNRNQAERAMTETGPSPRSQTPVWERPAAKLLFREAVGTVERARNGVSRARVPKQEFGNEEQAMIETKAPSV